MVLLVSFVTLAGILSAQRASNRVLVVNGKTTSVPILEVRGRSYVDVETLAQVANGSVTFQSNRIILTIPQSNSGSTTPEPPPRLSKEFASAALVELAEMREWKAAIETMISLQVPASEPWFQNYHDRAEESLRLAKVAASTGPDQTALQLLQNEFGNQAEWAGNAIATRQSLNATRTMNPNVLQNDPVLQKISNCGQSLSSMLVSGVFADIPSCH
jgi:hypothetical protein